MEKEVFNLTQRLNPILHEADSVLTNPGPLNMHFGLYCCLCKHPVTLALTRGIPQSLSP